MLPRLPPSLHVPRSPEEWQPSFQCLDVAGGTGDIALRLLDRAREKYSNRDVRVEIVDLNEGMLHEGRKRVAQTMYYNSGLQRMFRLEAAAQTRLCAAPQIEFTHGNAQSLPTHIASNSIDLYTIAFGIRNCTSLPAVLSEAYRVLKPGGKLGVLEFGKVSNPVFKE
jgi:2-methoxy-6-polyprenyl-1,4-benzoquinol methylase